MGPPGSILQLSECGQDFWVLDKLHYKENGTFIDLGAADGITGSNTFILEKFYKWQGVCVEPNPMFLKSLCGSRDVSICDLCAFDTSGKVLPFTFARDEMFYGWNFRAGISDIIDDMGDDGVQHKVFSITLNDIIELYSLPKDIDYVSMDIEGSEYSVLSSFDFNKYNVRCFTIEYYDEEQRQKINELMTANGYYQEQSMPTGQEDWYFK